ncbi:MAG: hypothetical protein CO170_04620 [candidate division SR1 bacterium CG_4_9_14_3_um_filter_40_9]|nr:MAG: hypothetical protein CO170_04620 [candidate division SR1 bacterium CG_4_9_14_3_um_filter_40_9]
MGRKKISSRLKRKISKKVLQKLKRRNKQNYQSKKAKRGEKFTIIEKAYLGFECRLFAILK